MDYPKRDDLLNGKFTDGDPVNGIPASRNSAEHMNAIYDELIALIDAAGITPVEGETTQVQQAVKLLSNFANLQGKEQGTGSYATKGRFVAGRSNGYVSIEDINWGELALGFNSSLNKASMNGSSSRIFSRVKDALGSIEFLIADNAEKDLAPNLQCILRLAKARIDCDTDIYVKGKLLTPMTAGAVHYFATTITPAGFLKANGAPVNRIDYADLFAAIGTTFGEGNGSTTFNLPDLRGEFIRGWDGGRGVDEGREFGSTQGDGIRNITGAFAVDQTLRVEGLIGAFKSEPKDNGNNYIIPINNGTTTLSTRLTFDASRIDGVEAVGEFRPHNIALAAYIKY